MNTSPSFFLRSLLSVTENTSVAAAAAVAGPATSHKKHGEVVTKSEHSHHQIAVSTTSVAESHHHHASNSSSTGGHMNGLEKGKEIVNKAIDAVSDKTKSINLIFFFFWFIFKQTLIHLNFFFLSTTLGCCFINFDKRFSHYINSWSIDQDVN
jgi:hypothetical protein